MQEILSVEKVSIHSAYIKLDQFLKYCGYAETGGQAKELILNNMVYVNNKICTIRGKKLYPKDQVRINMSVFEIVLNPE